MQDKQIKRAVISGGGTGGHIFPALAIAAALRQRFPEVEIRFVGAEGRMEMQRVPEAGYPIVGLPVRGLERRRWWRNLGVLRDFVLSLVQARRLLQDFAPDVVVGVGGYASAPTLKAAQSLGIPTLIQEQNSYAGLSNKMLARRAQRICVAYPEMERFFPKDKLVLTGNPLRPAIEFLNADRAEALSYFGLTDRGNRIVLVVGGSLGARTINDSIASHLAEWEQSGVTLVWQTGKAYAEEAQRLLQAYRGEVYCSAFIDRMDYAYTLADLVISRAGASSISELAHLGKPSILVPSPNVAEDHQTKNAMALSSRSAAVLVPDAEARDRLTAEALRLVQDDARLSALSAAISELALRDAASRIVGELIQIAR